MIQNGFWKPVELMEHLQFYDEKAGELKGDAGIGVVVSNRTGGKTVNMCIELLKQYETHKLKSIVCCRFAANKKGGKGSNPYFPEWFGKTIDINDDMGYIKKFKENHQIEYNADGLFVDGDQAFYCEALTDSKSIKDTRHYERIGFILLDEAIQEGESTLILNGVHAMTHLFRIWQTAARGWERAIDRCNIIFLSNVDEYDNWIFNDLHINDFVKPDTKRTSQNGIYFEKFVNEEKKRELMASTMGKIMQRSEAGKRYFIGSVLNEYTDNDAFIYNIGLDFTKLKVQLICRGKYVGIFDMGDSYHCAKIQKDKRSQIWTNDITNHTEGVHFDLASQWGGFIRSAYEAGKLTFQTQEAKNMILEYACLR